MRESEVQPLGPDGRKRRPHHPIALTAAATVIALTWVVPVVLMSNRGFDITDEGFYILSYRWWDTNTRTFTGAQFLYGPVFDALGHNIMAMRLFRLLTVLLFTGAFARAFMNWLATRNMRITGAWNAAGTMAILCSGGMI
jgi:hypothetical protein